MTKNFMILLSKDLSDTEIMDTLRSKREECANNLKFLDAAIADYEKQVGKRKPKATITAARKLRRTRRA